MHVPADWLCFWYRELVIYKTEALQVLFKVFGSWLLSLEHKFRPLKALLKVPSN